MITASDNATPIWYQRYNGRGERVRTQEGAIVGGNTARYYIYQEGGNVLGVYNNSGSRITEYIYMDGMLIAKSNGSGAVEIRYIETDHLGSPRAAFTTTGTKTWEWTFGGSAFGEHTANNDVDGDSNKEELSLRFPGQQYDVKTGLHYNYFRDYEPQTGRYVEGDPLGQAGGINLYEYSVNQPIRFSDPSGLEPVVQGCGGGYGIVVCDGQGGFEIRNCNTSCTRPCTQAHEQSHVSDFQSELPNRCKNRPRGANPAAEEDLIGSRFFYRSECKAHRLGKRCALSLKESCECTKEEIDEYVRGTDYYLERYQCERYGW
jgi:RHS repeat-associated protein